MEEEVEEREEIMEEGREREAGPARGRARMAHTRRTDGLWWWRSPRVTFAV